MTNSITESDSVHNNLETKSVNELLHLIHEEDKKVLPAIEKVIPDIQVFVQELVKRMKKGGRLFYIGAGTSGRLGVVDASEIPPTFGVGHGVVIGLIAGGDGAIRKAVEHAEDDAEQGWNDIVQHNPNELDTVVGIAASGRTPYVIGGVKKARENGLLTGCITSNLNTKLAEVAEYPIEPVVGPEFVTGSTRMKSGTAQKLVLNMITTTTMIQLGRVRGNKMVDMQLTNQKLIERGTRMIGNELGINAEQAKSLLLLHGSVRNAIDAFREIKN
ncbi:N-acetylmuramic acid 6-phosphate etherase [Saccharicrinis sp. FJH54]|uniref:N-acetylmuramic acid 6-phosphate etherase n=1 Tax=Saccharicrinis sp. FJH54 TaxID=3344665 RepID=UPI0035D48102